MRSECLTFRIDEEYIKNACRWWANTLSDEVSPEEKKKFFNVLRDELRDYIRRSGVFCKLTCRTTVSGYAFLSRPISEAVKKCGIPLKALPQDAYMDIHREKIEAYNSKQGVLETITEE